MLASFAETYKSNNCFKNGQCNAELKKTGPEINTIWFHSYVESKGKKQNSPITKEETGGKDVGDGQNRWGQLYGMWW